MFKKTTNDNYLKENRNYRITKGVSAIDICLNTSLSKLLDIFGQPSLVGSGDNKIQLEWTYSEEVGDSVKVFSIYDYKQFCAIHKIPFWRVGGKNVTVEEAKSLLSSMGFDEDEIVLI